MWAWHETDVAGALVRLSASTGHALQTIKTSSIGLGRMLNTPLLLTPSPTADGPSSNDSAGLTLLAGFATAAAGEAGGEGADASACAIVAIDLTPTGGAQVRWQWSDGGGACPAGQIGLLGGGALVYGRRDHTGVVALG